MIDAATRAILLDILQRESRSLLMYVCEVFPQAAPEEQHALTRILEMVKEEEHTVARLARFLQKNRVPLPPLGTYPSSFTTMNFISLDYLVPLLVAYQKRRIEEINGQLARITDPAARAQVQAIIDLKKQHALILQDLRSKTAAA